MGVASSPRSVPWLGWVCGPEDTPQSTTDGFLAKGSCGLSRPRRRAVKFTP